MLPLCVCRKGKGRDTYRLELLRPACDAAEKRYLQAVHAQEVCRNGEWGYYRLPAGSTFAQYACCDSKLAYLRGIYRRYLIFGAAVYIALAMDMSAFLSMRMTVLHGVALVLLTLLAWPFSVGLTRFHVVLAACGGALQRNVETGSALCRKSRGGYGCRHPPHCGDGGLLRYGGEWDAANRSGLVQPVCSAAAPAKDMDTVGADLGECSPS